MNFVGGTLAEGIVGGSAGEDVATYLEHIAAAAFIGVNHYPTWGDNTPAPVMPARVGGPQHTRPLQDRAQHPNVHRDQQR